MRMSDSDKLCAGKVWKHSHDAHQSLVESFGVAIEEYPDLQKIPDLFMTAWGKYHHPVLSLAYALNPEYHRSKPWLDPTVKKDIDSVLNLLAAGFRFLGRRIGGPESGPPSYIPSAPSGLGEELSWRMDYWGLDSSWVMT